MTQHYRDYIWREGIPYGIGPLETAQLHSASFKIAMDPYRKRISIEKYSQERFEKIIYDSALLDFRHLKPAEQTAWQKVTLSENEKEITAAIYNQDDRLIVIEKYFFEDKLCRRCESTSSHGIPIAYQKMCYKALGDPLNGVYLFDVNHHPVMLKQYDVDPETGEFNELIEEIWDGQKIANQPLAVI